MAKNRTTCGLLRREDDGCWYYGEIQVGRDNEVFPGALERAVEEYAGAPEPVLREWSPAGAQLSFAWPTTAPIVNVDDRRSLKEASAQVFAELDKGVFCPCCQRLARRYARRFHREMGVFLVYLVRAFREKRSWYHLREILPGGKSSPKASTDGAYLKNWGLVKRHPEKTGVYLPTDAGIAFVLGQTHVPRICFVYDGRPWHYSKETVGIRDVLGDRIDVLAMLQDTAGPEGR